MVFRLFLGAVFLLVSAQLSATEGKILRVCYGSWEPYIFTDKTGNITGIAHELLSHGIKGTGYALKYTSLPYKRCLTEVEIGRQDVLMFVSPGSVDLLETESVFAYWTLAAIVRKEDPLTRFTSLEQLQGRKLIIIDGYEYPGRLNPWIAAHPDIMLVNYGDESNDSYLIPFRLMELGRADLFIEDLHWSREFVRDNQLNLKVLEPAIESEGNTIGFRKELGALRDRIDETILTMSNAERDALFMKYTGLPEEAFSIIRVASRRSLRD